MALYHGKKSVIYLSTSGAAEATSIPGQSSWTLDMSTDTVEVTAFGDTNKNFVQGLANFSGTFGGFWDDTSDAIYDASRSTTPVKIYLYPSSDAPTKYWYGTAWASMNISAGVSEAVAISGSFVAASNWGQM